MKTTRLFTLLALLLMAGGVPFLLRCLVIQTMSIGARETQSLEMSDI